MAQHLVQPRPRQNRLRKEVELAVSRAEYDEQAQHLRATNYVYAEATYRTDLVDALPTRRAVPECFEACARFVKVNPDEEDLGWR